MSGRHSQRHDQHQSSVSKSQHRHQEGSRPRRALVSFVRIGAIVALVLFVSASGVIAPALSRNAPGRGHVVATPVHVQSGEGFAYRGHAVRARLNRPATSGDLLVVYAVWSNGGTVRLLDTQANRYVPARVSQTSWGNKYSAQVLYAKNLVGGASSVLAVFSQQVRFASLSIHEYAGVDQTSPFDGSAIASGSGTSPASGAVTTDPGWRPTPWLRRIRSRSAGRRERLHRAVGHTDRHRRGHASCWPR